MRKALVTTQIFCALLIAGCASKPAQEPTGSKAVTELDRGYCPGSIVDSRGRDGRGKLRYDKSATQITQYRNQELANCAALVATGNITALATLVSHYDRTGQTADLVKTLESYVEAGTEPTKLRDAGAYLYRAYTKGAPGVNRDADKAFQYLGVAVNSGQTALELTYARSLSDRGLHQDAMRYYASIAASNRSQLERCQANLSMSQLYFGRSQAHENWNLGYYYWQEGLALAKSPEWGSCAKDNFSSATYSEESERLKFVEQRLALMSPAQKQVVDEARRDPRKGQKFVAALSFQKPSGAPVASATPRIKATSYLPGWPAWAPANAQICNNLKYSGSELRWNEVFELNAQAIWTVDSRNGTSKSQGSAVAVSPSELVTNCHLIENPKQITLRRVGWNLPARLKAADRKGDRCILEVGNTLPTYVRRGRNHAAVKIGEDVAAIGNPKGLETSLSRGIVGQKRSRGGLTLIQTDAAISSGSSGGGLFDRAGYLVGVTTFTIAEGQSLNFAIAIDEFCR